MADPTPVVRAVTYERDGERCVSCGVNLHLTYQHRQAVGAGGSKVRPGFVDGVTACASCNEGFEGRLQARALRFGWKVRRWVRRPGDVPVWYALERSWFRLERNGSRVRVSAREALLMMVDVYGDEYAQMVEAAS